MPHPYRSYVTVSRERLARNYRALGEAAGPGVEMASVVKANAYGHGAVEVARILEAQGARWLAVSSVEEGVELRQGGIQARILVLAGFLPFEGQAVVEYGLTPALAALGEVAEMDRLSRACGRPLPYHLKLDTGMGRLGTLAGPEEIAAAIGNAPHARFEGLMTHFASAADFTTGQTADQKLRFAAVLEGLRAAGLAPEFVHIAATDAVAYAGGEPLGNMARPGLALYGYVSPARGEAPAGALDVAPALEWKAHILCVKDVPEGTALGYNATFRAPRPMRIAVIGVGYADGVFRCLSNRGSVIAAGRLAPMLGTVCMDLITVDIGHAPGLAPGDEVTLIGEENGVKLDAAQVAATAGTIAYEVLCAIGRRVKRVYI